MECIPFSSLLGWYSVRSDEHVGELGHVGHDEVGLVRGGAEGALAAVDERGVHPGGLGADAVEGVVRDEEDRVQAARR
jgi:hypothetical protein